jgi:hypothetical protein
MTAKDDGKTRDFLGLPLFRRLYGFGDVLTLRARMTTAVFARVDRGALAGALPRHPRVKLHRASPLVLVQSDFTHCADNGDPLANDYAYREVMLACVLEGAAGLFGPMWPLALFLDEPLAICAGREFHGFPKVPAVVTYEADRARVDFASRPGGKARVDRVLSTRWAREPGVLARAIGAAKDAIAGAVRAAGVDADTVDLFAQLALAPTGEVWNLHQVPDLANPRRAAMSRLTRFKPVVSDPSDVALVGGFALELPSAGDERTWTLGRRFFGARDEAVTRDATFAFAWSATMRVSGGEVLDVW